MTEERVFDPGLQPERTLLAWRRTALSLGVAGVVGGRLALDQLGPISILLALAAVVAALTAYIWAAHRYRRTHAHLVAEAARLPGGGFPLVLLTSGAVLLALGALGYVAVLVAGR